MSEPERAEAGAVVRVDPHWPLGYIAGTSTATFRSVMDASGKQVHCFMIVCLVASLLSLAGCVSEQRRAEEQTRMQREAAQEVRRICALPRAEREVELENIRRESDIELYCGAE